MPRDKSLTNWKRKKSEVEARVKELEALRVENISWLEKASKTRSMLWKRTEYLKFLQKQQRLHEVVKETALKLDSAKQELQEIKRSISSLEKNRSRTVFALGGITVVVLMMMISLFAYGPFSNDSLTGAVVSDFGEESSDEADRIENATIRDTIDASNLDILASSIVLIDADALANATGHLSVGENIGKNIVRLNNNNLAAF